MGTLGGSILKQLVGGDAVDPHIVNLMRNQWQSRIGVVRSLGCVVHINILRLQKGLGTVTKQKD
uniref:Uncharacterized protein n=1 Tax=Romanomermis culicivorax TaxID=13658 RepID=A0A915JJI5_ROMCU